MGNWRKAIIGASDKAAEAGEHVRRFRCAACDASPPLLLDGLLVLAAVSGR